MALSPDNPVVGYDSEGNRIENSLNSLPFNSALLTTGDFFLYYHLISSIRRIDPPAQEEVERIRQYLEMARYPEWDLGPANQGKPEALVLFQNINHWGKHFGTETQIVRGSTSVFKTSLDVESEEYRESMFSLVESAFADCGVLLRAILKDIDNNVLDADKMLAALIVKEDMLYHKFRTDNANMFASLQGSDFAQEDILPTDDDFTRERKIELRLRQLVAEAGYNPQHSEHNTMQRALTSFARQASERWSEMNPELAEFDDSLSVIFSKGRFYAFAELLAGVPVRDEDYVHSLITILRREKLYQQLFGLSNLGDPENIDYFHEDAAGLGLGPINYGLLEDENGWNRFLEISRKLFAITQLKDEDLFAVGSYLPSVGAGLIKYSEMSGSSVKNNIIAALMQHLLITEIAAIRSSDTNSTHTETFNSYCRLLGVPTPEDIGIEELHAQSIQKLYAENTNFGIGDIIRQLPREVCEYIGRYWSFFNSTYRTCKR